RPREEVEAARRDRDPLTRLRPRLHAALADAIDEESQTVAAEAAEWAEAQPEGDLATLLDHTYAQR
ncbi:MAG: pyruvate dehydrogenase (acetyl-transferring) E1 component subunit alpha, partial [bacterium]|nr:pyruvate dehydrogenase (acetyl-transferring) E1 component subunit alpha [bacterium]